MEVMKSAASRLWDATGPRVSAGNLTKDQLERKLTMLPQLVNAKENPLTGDNLVLFKHITKAIAEGEDIYVIEDNGHAKEEEDLPSDYDDPVPPPPQEVDEEDFKPENNVVVKKGRKAKDDPKEEEEVESDMEVPATYTGKSLFREVSKPKHVKVDRALAKKFAEMVGVPGDRGNEKTIQKARREMHREAILTGNHRGNEWATVKVLSDGKTYRVNGKTTAMVLLDLFNQKVEFPPFVAVIREYEADDYEGAAALYATFDNAKSSRSKSDLTKTAAYSIEELRSLSSRSLSLVTAGLSFEKWETKYRRVPTTKQASLLHDNVQFALWVSEILPAKKRGRKKKDAEETETVECDHMRRVPVIAAMARTYFRDPHRANEFWGLVRDDMDGGKGHPIRKLRNFLLTYGIGAPSGEKKVVSDREMYVKCLLAWNSYAAGETTTNLNYFKDMETPEAL